MDRTILHIDMDAFFASVAQRDNPQLKGKPVAVIGSNARTVIVSPSYEARGFGVKTGMTRQQAKLRCTGIVFVPADNAKYSSICAKIAGILYAFTPDIEVSSIDEFFLDITTSMHLFGTADSVAVSAKTAVKKELGLDCSIGISHNKLLAKLASEKAKPAGICRISRQDVIPLFERTKVGMLCGIGKETCRQLASMGIYKLGQLRECSVDRLKRKFGINGIKLSFIAHGIDNSAVVPFYLEEEAKTMGHSMTFGRDISDMRVLSRQILKLAETVGRRLRKAGLSAGTIKLTIRYKSFKTFTRQRVVAPATDDTKNIYHTARSILENVKRREPIRLLGITGSKLSAPCQSGCLFTQGSKNRDIDKILDHINERFGSPALSFASLLNEDRHSRVISPAWRPVGNRNY